MEADGCWGVVNDGDVLLDYITKVARTKVYNLVSGIGYFHLNARVRVHSQFIRTDLKVHAIQKPLITINR